MTTGEQIVGARKSQGYSQEELSHVSGISLRTIQRIEKGEVNPRGYTLKTLAQSLKIELRDLTTQDVSTDDKAASKIRSLNTLGLLVILFPLVSALIQIVYWTKNKHLLSSRPASRKVLSFQILWIVVVLIFFSLVQILTYSITGQSVYGHFPVRTTGYLVLLLANISVILYTASKLNRNSPVLLSGVPSLV
ncbi:MAG: helix-turn-helix domain-containing protein [Imperialibacter sp.]|uniref:helix-turn-helix domain-containing protein n=1 Tax=Imperialibacter sp. TaxID=2038411 RepID=UPI0032EB5B1F